MARLFDTASAQYLLLTSAILTAEPISISAWYRPNNLTGQHIIFAITGDATGTEFVLRQRSGNVEIFKNGAGTTFTSGGLSLGDWAHTMGIFASTTSRSVYINGGGKVTNTQSITGGTFTRTGIGARPHLTPIEFLKGDLAEIGVWNVALSDAEVALLAKGFSPLFIRPQNLVAYWPLIRDDDNDLIGRFDLTAINTPTVATHPPLIKHLDLAMPTYIFLLGMKIHSEFRDTNLVSVQRDLALSALQRDTNLVGRKKDA